MNPILNRKEHIPDSEARVFGSRLYIYGSLDIEGADHWCSKIYKVFSTDDLINWTDHGIAFNSDDLIGTPFYSVNLYAPDCIYKDGKYYLYFCTDKWQEGVAVSDTPYGHFTDPVLIDTKGFLGIDPSVFIDDDNQAYYFWDQFNLRGAKLNEDMTTIDETSINPSVLNEYLHGFHEGSSIRKRNGIYYMVYSDISRGKATCLAYATATNPLGPYTKRGVIVDNAQCDPKSWNNHGSICEFNGNWYIFYHRASKGTPYNRRACIEPITFNEDGTINEVTMTMSGTEMAIKATDKIEAYRASYLDGDVHTIIEDGEEYLSFDNEAIASFKYLEFCGEEKLFKAQIKPTESDCELEISTGSFVGQAILGKAVITKGEKHILCNVKTTKGINTLYLRCSHKCSLQILDFHFE